MQSVHFSFLHSLRTTQPHQRFHWIWYGLDEAPNMGELQRQRYKHRIVIDGFIDIVGFPQFPLKLIAIWLVHLKQFLDGFFTCWCRESCRAVVWMKCHLARRVTSLDTLYLRGVLKKAMLNVLEGICPNSFRKKSDFDRVRARFNTRPPVLYVCDQ